jgi:hypothetical protein
MLRVGAMNWDGGDIREKKSEIALAEDLDIDEEPEMVGAR